MNKTELRVGNFIGMDLKEFTDNYFTLTEIGNTIQVADGCWSLEEIEKNRISKDYYDLEDFEGIPITKGWLREFGAKNMIDVYWLPLYNLKAELHFEVYEK